MSLCIKGIGTAVPPHSIAQEDAAEAAAQLCGLSEKQRRLLPTLYRHAGVRKRHSAVLASGADRSGVPQGNPLANRWKKEGRMVREPPNAWRSTWRPRCPWLQTYADGLSTRPRSRRRDHAPGDRFVQWFRRRGSTCN